jgi:hypothetical protein
LKMSHVSQNKDVLWIYQMNALSLWWRSLSDLCVNWVQGLQLRVQMWVCWNNCCLFGW